MFNIFGKRDDGGESYPATDEPDDPDDPGGDDLYSMKDEGVTNDVITVLGILAGTVAMYGFNPSTTLQNAYVLSMAIWRYVSFYRKHDGKAGVAAGVYWGSSLYLYGPKYMPASFLLDYVAGACG